MNHLDLYSDPLSIWPQEFEKRKLSLKFDTAFLKKDDLVSFKSDFSIAQSFGQDQCFYVKIAKTTTLLGLEPRNF